MSPPASAEKPLEGFIDLEALIAAAIGRSETAFKPGGKLVIRSVSAKQRPRRRPAV